MGTHTSTGTKEGIATFDAYKTNDRHEIYQQVLYHCIVVLYSSSSATSNILNVFIGFAIMLCPYCHSNELKVTDSRDAIELNAIRRRRECLKCLRRFTTFETVELTLQVHKRDGRFEDFQQQKLINGLDAACHHTTISREQVITLAARITCELQQRHSRVISSHEIGELIMQELLKLDPVAFIRFACVYRRIKDIDKLKNEIASIPSKDDQPNEKFQVNLNFETDNIKTNENKVFLTLSFYHLGDAVYDSVKKGNSAIQREIVRVAR